MENIGSLIEKAFKNHIASGMNTTTGLGIYISRYSRDWVSSRVHGEAGVMSYYHPMSWFYRDIAKVMLLSARYEVISVTPQNLQLSVLLWLAISAVHRSFLTLLWFGVTARTIIPSRKPLLQDFGIASQSDYWLLSCFLISLFILQMAIAQSLPGIHSFQANRCHSTFLLNQEGFCRSWGCCLPALWRAFTEM